MKSRKTALKQEYQLRFSNIREYRCSVWKILCSDFFRKYIPKNAAILDIGAGWGEFINNMEAAKKFAMDLNPETGDYLTDDIIFLNHDCSKRWKLDDNILDVVFSSNFFEHLPNKESIENTISEAYRCLKKNGKVIFLGPNIKYIHGAYWDFWDHCIPLTESSLREILMMKGFRIDLCIARFLPYSMSTGIMPPPFLIKIYLKFPFVWRIVGKQFLVIGRKE